MPSSYTAYILEDKLSKPSDFAKLCARAFGACINQRDDSLDVPLEIPKPDTEYHEKEIKTAEKQVKKLRGMTKAQKITYGSKILKERIKSAKQSIAEKQKNKEKLQAVLDWVQTYNPPTPEHVHFKEFMVQQVTDTMNWDGDASYHEEALKNYSEMSPLKIWADHLESAKDDIVYHEKNIREEIERANSRADWIAKLVESLN